MATKRIPLLGGAYTARSIIASAQECINLFPEKNPQDAEAPITHYLTPGLLRHVIPPTQGVGRCLYTATNGRLYYVCGQKVYYIDSNFVPTTLGTMLGTATTPVSMVDNGNAVVIVDGSVHGYAINLADNSFSPIADPNFLGGDRVDYVDTFLVLNQPGTRNYYSSLSNCTYGQLTTTGAFDPTYVAAKTGFPDQIATLCCVHREIWLFGIVKTTEVWYDAGGAAFPFAIMPGIFIEHGCAAKYSVCKHDLLVFWLSIDQEGQGTVFMAEGYKAVKITTPAIANEIAQYTMISDAIGMMYKQGDHIFYILTFPTADVTWVFDLSEGLWHRRAWTDPDTGLLHRWRGNCMAIAYGLVLASDWANGTLYQLDLNTYTDFDGPISRIRSFPHLVADGKRVEYESFILDVECGNGSVSDPTTSPMISLSYSDTRGRTYGTRLEQSLGAQGEYLTQPKWNKLGLARDRVFKIEWSGDVKTAVNGAWIEATPSDS